MKSLSEARLDGSLDEQRFRDLRDRFHHDVTRIVDMGQRTLDRLLDQLGGDGGRIAPSAGEFGSLTQCERTQIETIYGDLFG